MIEYMCRIHHHYHHCLLFTLIIVVKEVFVLLFRCSFFLAAYSLLCRSDGHHGHRLLLESMQQRLLDQQTLAERLREDLSAAKLEEERAQDRAWTVLGEVVGCNTHNGHGF